MLDRLHRNPQKRERIEQARNSLARKGALRQTAAEFRCGEADIEEALREIERGYPFYGKNLTQGMLMEMEYLALLEELPNADDDLDYMTRHQTAAWQLVKDGLVQGSRPRKVMDSIDRLIAVERLKEILVLVGFHRLDPKNPLVPPDIIGKSHWLPALELYGEGIFFTLDEHQLALWETHPLIKIRAEFIMRRFAVANVRFSHEITLTPRFLLLHTLAHLLIRELETEAGYPAASLRERIYCTAGETPMAGSNSHFGRVTRFLGMRARVQSFGP